MRQDDVALEVDQGHLRVPADVGLLQRAGQRVEGDAHDQQVAQGAPFVLQRHRVRNTRRSCRHADAGLAHVRCCTPGRLASSRASASVWAKYSTVSAAVRSAAARLRYRISARSALPVCWSPAMPTRLPASSPTMTISPTSRAARLKRARRKAREGLHAENRRMAIDRASAARAPFPRGDRLRATVEPEPLEEEQWQNQRGEQRSEEHTSEL